MKKSKQCMIAVYLLFTSVLALSIVEIILSKAILTTFSDYLDIKGIILFKINGDESLVKPLVVAGIVMSSIFIGVTLIDLSLYFYQNHMRKIYLPVVTAVSTLQFIIFTAKVICFSSWASHNSSQYTPYTKDKSFCDGFNFILSKLPQKTMCNFVEEWIFYIKFIFPFQFSYIFVYCVFLSILFRSQKYTQKETTQKIKDEDIHFGSVNVSENFIKSPEARSYCN